jgi:hypothetical protein
VGGAIAGGSEINHAQIHTQKVHRLYRGGIRQHNRGIQIPLALTLDEVDLAAQTVHISGLILAIDHGDPLTLTALQGEGPSGPTPTQSRQQADVCRAFPR